MRQYFAIAVALSFTLATACGDGKSSSPSTSNNSGNANPTTGSIDTGTPAATTFTIKSSAWTVTTYGDQQVVSVLLSDAADVCGRLSNPSDKDVPTLAVVQVSRLKGEVGAGTYPVVNPNDSSAAAAVEAAGGFATVALLKATGTAVPASTGTFKLTSLDIAAKGALAAALDSDDGSRGKIAGNIEAAYCEALTTVLSGGQLQN